MKRGGVSTDKNSESKAPTKSVSEIKFNLSDNILACFKSKDISLVPKPKTDCLKDYKWVSQQKQGM